MRKGKGKWGVSEPHQLPNTSSEADYAPACRFYFFFSNLSLFLKHNQIGSLSVSSRLLSAWCEVHPLRLLLLLEIMCGLGNIIRLSALEPISFSVQPLLLALYECVYIDVCSKCWRFHITVTMLIKNSTACVRCILVVYFCSIPNTRL